MLKINLLPAYIYEKRKVRRAAMGFGLLFIAVVFGMLGWWIMLSNKQKQLQAQVADMEMRAQEVMRLEQAVQAEESRIPVVQAKVGFIEGVMDYNLQAPRLYEELAKYTYSRVQYRSLAPSGSQLVIDARARTLGDCGRYLMNMYRATHLFNSVAISGVPGWPPAGGGAGATTPGAPEAGPTTGFDFQVTCALVQPIAPPAYAGVGAQGPGAVVPGMPAAGPPPSGG
ncbi:MAG TPA: hypothetical protein VMX94_04105 [Armatimonadota bacterium]|nr:hypothetical protein [Armatimonadota bacterium]